jgi:hypothetical protein
MYTAQANTENYFCGDDESRQLWYLTKQSVCPFGDHCKAWEKHAKTCWSAISEHNVRCYVKQHAMRSSNHHLATDLSFFIAEDRIDEIVGEVGVTGCTDTAADRAEWGRSLAKGTKRKHEPGAETVATVQQLQAAVQQLQAAAGQVSQSSCSALPPPRALMPPPGLPGLLSPPDSMMSTLMSEPAAQPGMRDQIVMVSMQASQLQLLLDTVRRSKEAVKSAMQALVIPLQSLKGELAVLHNAELLIQESQVQVANQR